MEPRRSRGRQKDTGVSNALSALDQLKAGKSRGDTFVLTKDKDILETVDEAEYREIVEKRKGDAFIEADGDGDDLKGYEDDGEEWYTKRDKGEVSGVIEEFSGGKKKKDGPTPAQKKRIAKLAPEEDRITTMLARNPQRVVGPATSLDGKRKSTVVKKASKDDEKWLDDQLDLLDYDPDDKIDDLDAAMDVEESQLETLKATKAMSMDWESATAPMQEEPEDNEGGEDEKRSGGARNTLKATTLMRQDEGDMGVGVDMELSMDVSTFADLPVSDEEAVRFFWFDASEDRRAGSVYLFGKTFDASSRVFRPVVVKVSNIDHIIWVEPTPPASEDLPVDWRAIGMEIQTELRKIGVSKSRMKVVTKGYAFDKKNENKQVLEVLYAGKFPNLNRELAGRTFSRVYGTTSPPIETFLISRRIMGPCWLSIHAPKSNPTQLQNPTSMTFSWVPSEYVLDSASQVEVVTSASKAELPLPPLTATAFTVITRNSTSGAEIVVCTLLTHKSFSILPGSATTNWQDKVQTTIVHCLGKTSIPSNNNDPNRKIVSVADERALLSCVMAKLSQLDPDVLIGHNFLGYTLDVLLHRMKKHGLPGAIWSKLGRLRRSILPRLQSGMGGLRESTWEEKEIVRGRLVADTYISAKEFLPKSTSYSLSHLSEEFLKSTKRDLLPGEISAMCQKPSEIPTLLDVNSRDAFLSFELMTHMQLLPLTMQLTQIAGNLWSRTLIAGRSERNEYLLLHEFWNIGYISPNKPMTEKSKDFVSHEAEMDLDQGLLDGNDRQQQSKQQQQQNFPARRKAQYLGGLVLEPKRGFYETMILYLDFNSLYPSIIQEYNICFTTVDRNTAHSDVDRGIDENDLCDLPEEGIPTGVLPRVLRTLVERRRSVKKLMNDAESPEKKAEYNTRQMALKLTANSMYGCLGFTFSRFYAKELASLITFHGREALKVAHSIAEEEGYEVIYGDTDSIMINTRTKDVNEVEKIAEDLIAKINIKFKLLEIDIDGIFQSMLLLKKKKYAATLLTKKSIPGRGDVWEPKRETKGLDLVRRDWCILSKEVGKFVVDAILKTPSKDELAVGESASEIVVHKIHQHLRDVVENMKPGKKYGEIKWYAISRSLMKPPEQYSDIKSQPHVKVAQRLRAKGISTAVGTVIPYVICRNASDDPNSKTPTGNLADRAYHPNEVLEKNGELVVDLRWYKEMQILGPVSRLVAPLEGTSISQIADCLGLDPNAFANRDSSSSGRGFGYGDADDNETRFKLCERLEVPCPKCDKVNKYEGEPPKNFKCSGCSEQIPTAYISNLLRLFVSERWGKISPGEFRCDSCERVTRWIRAGGRLSLRCPWCDTGEMKPVYSGKQFDDQLSYFKNVFKAQTSLSLRKKAKDSNSGGDGAITDDVQAIGDYLNSIKSGYQTINIAEFFA